jgi:hypothetical protein
MAYEAMFATRRRRWISGAWDGEKNGGDGERAGGEGEQRIEQRRIRTGGGGKGGDRGEDGGGEEER